MGLGLLSVLLVLVLLAVPSWASHGLRHGARRRASRFVTTPNLAAIQLQATNALASSTAYRLHDDLLRHYRKSTRPKKNPQESVQVQVYTALYQIIHLDQAKNTIVLAGSFEFYWQDEFLKWDPADYEGTSELFLSSEEIWIPEISLYYSHHHNEEVVLRTNNDVRLNYTGHLRYYIPFTTESLCPIDVKYFPFDKQTCSLFFGSWAHSNESISFSLFEKSGIDLRDFYDNQEWQMLEQDSDIKEDKWAYDYAGTNLFWSVLVLKVVVERQSFYYVFNLVIPSTIITIVAVVGFHMPSTSGRVSFALSIVPGLSLYSRTGFVAYRDAKFRLGIITLMSMSVILLAIVEDMPKFAISARTGKRGSFSGVPLIGLYYFSLLVVIGTSTISTSFFVLLERDGRHQKRIPWWLSWLSFGHWRRYKGYERPPSRAGTDGEPETPRAELRRKLSLGHYDNLVLFHYFHGILEELAASICSIEKALSGIRHELLSLLPKDDIENRWTVIIRRLELLSMFFYLSIILTILLMFFFHGWYKV